MNKEKDNKKDSIEIDPVRFIIPECCREGWVTCPHVVKRQKKTKKNIAL